MSRLDVRANPYMYTEEEIASVGKPNLEDPVDFSYPDGFFQFVNSLDFISDVKMRIGMVCGFMSAIPSI